MAESSDSTETQSMNASSRMAMVNGSTICHVFVVFLAHLIICEVILVRTTFKCLL